MKMVKLKKQTKRKISEKLKGRIFLEEHKRKLSLALKGKPKSEEHIKKIRDYAKNNVIGKSYEQIHGKEKAKKMKERLSYLNKGKNNNMFGRTHSKEARKKISESRKGKKFSKRKNHTGKNIKCLECKKERYIYNCILKNNPKRKFFCSLPCKINYFRKNREYFLMDHRKDFIFPNKNTTIEIKIQNFLKQLGIEFFTHQYMKEIEHAYQCDILIPSMNLVIECDGDYWHKYPIGRLIDVQRTQELLDKGFKVLRIWESEIRVITLPEFQNKINQIK